MNTTTDPDVDPNIRRREQNRIAQRNSRKRRQEQQTVARQRELSQAADETTICGATSTSECGPLEASLTASNGDQQTFHLLSPTLEHDIFFNFDQYEAGTEKTSDGRSQKSASQDSQGQIWPIRRNSTTGQQPKLPQDLIDQSTTSCQNKNTVAYSHGNDVLGPHENWPQEASASTSRLLQTPVSPVAARDDCSTSVTNKRHGSMATLDRMSLSTAFDAQGQTCLHIAARAGSAGLVQFLLEQNMSLEATDDDGFTALHHAVRAGNRDTVAVLIRGGANLEVLDDLGRTALHLAVECMNLEVVVLLVRNGANLGARVGRFSRRL